MINQHPSEYGLNRYKKPKKKPGIVAPGVDTTQRQKKLMDQNKKHYSKLKQTNNMYHGRYTQ